MDSEDGPSSMPISPFCCEDPQLAASIELGGSMVAISEVADLSVDVT